MRYKRNFAIWLAGLMFLSAGFAPLAVAVEPVILDSPVNRLGSISSFDDWDDAAAGAAQKLQQVYEVRTDIMYLPVYIETPNGFAFSAAFKTLLKTHLVNRGMKVSEFRDDRAIPLRFTIQPVRTSELSGGTAVPYTSSFLQPDSLPDALPKGRLDMLLTVSLVYNGRYVMSYMAEGTVSPRDYPAYAGPQGLDEESGTSRTISIIGR